MYTSKCENILFTVDEKGIATVTLNRAEALNALTWDMEKELGDIFYYCSYAEETPHVAKCANRCHGERGSRRSSSFVVYIMK